MKKTILITMALLVLTTGCATTSNTTTTTASPEETSVSTRIPVSEDAYEEYSEAVKNLVEEDSYTAAVSSMYRMKFSDDTYNVYTLDGVLEKDEDGTYHVTENFDSNGLPMSLEGYYYGGRLYNNYNDVTYYEDLTEEELKETLVTPLDPYSFAKAQLSSVKSYEENGNTVYELTLTKDARGALFTARYDIYGLSDYEDYTVSKGVVEDTFDEEGHLLEEVTEFTVRVTYSDQVIDVEFKSTLNYTKYGETEVELTSDMKKEQKTYVAAEDIDTSSIETETTDDDSAEKDTITTFKKRLIGRLGYAENSDGTLTLEYNEHEAYTIDLKNKTFMYSRYTIDYIYNWAGDIGTMSDCTYTFSTEKQSSGCNEQNVEMLEDVKEYLEMELYYCGLTLSDLVNNTAYE